MRIFVAGGSGAIGLPLVRALAAAGHQVTATTRSAGKQPMLRAAGATPVVVDALDALALDRAVRAASPTHVIHQLTALPKAGPRRASDLDATNRLRETGTRNLLRAAIAAGARRIIGGSFAMIPASSADGPLPASLQGAADAVQSMESQMIDAARRGEIEAIVLRYGLFYGSGNPGTDEMVALIKRHLLPTIRHDHSQLPFIHTDDAVSATIAALDRGVSGGIYDIVDDQSTTFSEMVERVAAVVGAPRPFAVPGWLLRLLMPYTARMLQARVSLSNAKARAELGWRPAFPSYREGLQELHERAA